MIPLADQHVLVNMTFAFAVRVVQFARPIEHGCRPLEVTETVFDWIDFYVFHVHVGFQSVHSQLQLLAAVATVRTMTMMEAFQKSSRQNNTRKIGTRMRMKVQPSQWL
jgi:hypothetical protein